jgi:dihydroorotate dehydrogenase electron transfer subunit
MTQINRNAQQILAPILSNKRVGQYHQIIVNVGEIAAQCKPGNFVAISVGGDSSRMVLRRAFAISRVSTNSTVGGTMEFNRCPTWSGQ